MYNTQYSTVLLLYMTSILYCKDVLYCVLYRTTVQYSTVLCIAAIPVTI